MVKSQVACRLLLCPTCQIGLQLIPAYEQGGYYVPDGLTFHQTATGDGRQPGELDVEGLNGYRCKAGARISLPIRKFIGEGEMKLIWGGLVGAPDENVEGLITYKCEPMVCKLTTVGGTVCMLVAKPVEGRPKATEG